MCEEKREGRGGAIDIGAWVEVEVAQVMLVFMMLILCVFMKSASLHALLNAKLRKLEMMVMRLSKPLLLLLFVSL
jgi:hypothetical protein